MVHPLAIPDHPFRAYLFDCDGTIADSMPLHYIAWTRTLARHGSPFTEEQFYGWGGRPSIDIVTSLNEQHGLRMSPEEVEVEKEALYLELIPQVKGIPAVLAEIERMHGTIPFAVVSGGPRYAVERTLTALRLLDRFDLLVCAGDYPRGKPAPDPFLVAAEKLGVPPAECLVFEDAELGIQSAIAAGMQWIRIERT